VLNARPESARSTGLLSKLSNFSAADDSALLPGFVDIYFFS
jgi:hypothetical protein